jgi:hypothetical protein
MNEGADRQSSSALTRESNALRQELVRVHERVRDRVNTGRLRPDVLQVSFNLHEAATRLDNAIVQFLGSAQYARSAGVDLTTAMDAACAHAIAALRQLRDQAQILAIQHDL